MINGDTCGPLDVGDVRAAIPTDPLAADDVAAAMRDAQTSPVFDGRRGPVSGSPVSRGVSTVAKAQHRTHERYETVTWFEAVRTTTGIPAPALLDSGTVTRGHGDVWWSVLQRVRGQEVAAPTPAQQRAVGAALRRWHESAPPHGLRLDDDGGLGVFLGTPRGLLDSDGYLALAVAIADACAGQPMVPIHGDVAVCHNAMFRGEELAAIIDPGAVHVGPPMLDLAWCLAVDLLRGADQAPLLQGYGRDAVDGGVLDALVPLTQLRFLVDLAAREAADEFARLADDLIRRVPRLVDATGVLRYDRGGGSRT